MAGIQIAPGRHCQVLCSGAAAGKPFVDAGASGQINHEMEEIEIIFLSMAAHHLRGQLIILLTNHRNILFPERVGLFRSRHHRLHGNLFEAQIRQMQHILSEIQVIPGKGSSHIIIVLIPALRQLLELGHNQIIASVAVPERTHFIIDFLTAVNA